jgi:gamma-glutamylputrescine oxidase
MRNLPLPLSLWRETASPAADVEELDSSRQRRYRDNRCGIYRPLGGLARHRAGFASGHHRSQRGRLWSVGTKWRRRLHEIPCLAERHGKAPWNRDRGRMSRLGHEAMDCVEHYVESCGIATSGFAKTDNLRCAHNALACPLGEARGQRRRAHRAARNGQGEASHHCHERLLRRDARDVRRAHGGHSVSQCDDRDGTAPE